MNEFMLLLGCWLISAALLTVEHVTLWGHPWRLVPPYNYIVGVATLLFADLIWAFNTTTNRPIDAFYAFATIATSGAAIVLGYYIRNRIDLRDKARDMAQQAHQLTQSLIDQGGRRNARESEIHDRRN